MDQRRARPGMAAAQADPTESRRDVDILVTPPLEAHVVSIHSLEVGARDAQEVSVASIGRLELGQPASTDLPAIATREVDQGCRLLPCAKPIDHAPAMHGQRVFEHACREWLRELDSPTRDEPTRLDARADRADEMAAGYRLAVQEHQIVRVARERAEVQDSGKTESLVRLPDVSETLTEAGPPAIDDRRRFGARAVIGNNQREVTVRLITERAQNGIQCLGPLVGTYDDPEAAREQAWELPPSDRSAALQQEAAHQRLEHRGGARSSRLERPVEERPDDTAPLPANTPRAESPSPGSSTSNEIAS